MLLACGTSVSLACGRTEPATVACVQVDEAQVDVASFSHVKR